MKKSILVGLLIGVSVGLMVLIQDAQACACGPIQLQPSGFAGPTFEWDAYGNPVDPTDEEYKAVWTARNHWGIGAVLVSEYDPTATPTDTPGCYYFDLTQPNISPDTVEYLLYHDWFATSSYDLWSPGCRG